MSTKTRRIIKYNTLRIKRNITNFELDEHTADRVERAHYYVPQVNCALKLNDKYHKRRVYRRCLL